MDAFVFVIVLLLLLQGCIRYSTSDLVSTGKIAYSSYAYEPAEKAVDGNDVPYINQGGCFFTDADNFNWWKLDLETEFQVAKIVIILSLDDLPAQYSLLNANVLVGNNGEISSENFTSDNSQCGRNITIEELNTTSLVDLTCSAPIHGRFVFITRETLDEHILTFCEVFIYSTSEGTTYEGLPLNPFGLWPLNSAYSNHDVSGARNFYKSASVTEFQTNSASFGNYPSGTYGSITIKNLRFTGNITITFDIKPAEISIGKILAGEYFTISQMNSGDRVYASQINFSIAGIQYINTVFSSNTWVSIAIAYDHTALSVWRNGFLVRKNHHQNMPYNLLLENMEVGFNNEASGKMKNLHIYNRSLNQQEINHVIAIPLQEKMSLQTAKSWISSLYLSSSNMFKVLKSSTFAVENLTNTLAVRTIQDCAFTCFKELLCNSYAFNRGSRHCIYSKEFVEEKQLIADERWDIYLFISSEID